MSFGPAGVGAASSDNDCKICGKQSTGIHYSCRSCEGCKAFYRRSVTKKISYRCALDCKFYSEPSELCPSSRCQTCRFQKCLMAGMDLGGSKRGRIPKKLKCQSTKVDAPKENLCSDLIRSPWKTNAVFSSFLPRNEHLFDQVDIQDLPRKYSFDGISQINLPEMCSSLKNSPEATVAAIDKAYRAGFGVRLKKNSDFMELMHSDPTLPMDLEITLDEVAFEAAAEISQMVTGNRAFLELLPGMDRFTLGEIRMILCEKWQEMWLVMHATAWHNNEMYWPLGDTGIQYSFSRMASLLSKRFIVYNVRSIELIQDLELTELELYTFMAVLVLQPETFDEAFQNRPLLEFLYAHYMDTLLKLLSSQKRLNDFLMKKLQYLLARFRAVHRHEKNYLASINLNQIPWVAENDSDAIEELYAQTANFEY